MTVRVLLVGEGPSEIGHEAPWTMRNRKRRAQDGYFQPMLRQLLGDGLAIDAQTVVHLPPRPRRTRLPGHADKAASARLIANTQEYDVLVYAKDVDRAGVSEVAEQIQQGFDAHPSADTRTIKATPCRMIEAWALGDRDALQPLIGRDGDVTEVPADPETLSGDETDPASRHPKRVLARVLGRSPTTKDFAALGETSAVATLDASCPDSFRPFRLEAEAVRAVIDADS